MLSYTKSNVLNGVSSITENGTTTQVASLYASLDDKGNRNENVSILNQTLYEQNKTEIEEDIKELKKMANELKSEGK